MRKILAVATAAAALGVGAPAVAATTLNANWTEGCGKSTCFSEQGVFSKTWSAKDASGPVDIGKLLMDRGVLGSLESSTFRISFTLNGQEIGSWGSYMMAGIGGDQLSFGGEIFTWNPEDGDLVLMLKIAQAPKTGSGGGSFAAMGAPSEDTPPASKDEGGPTEFRGGAETPAIFASAAPEPSSWALMIAGFGMAGITIRRRGRAVAQPQPIR